MSKCSLHLSAMLFSASFAIIMHILFWYVIHIFFHRGDDSIDDCSMKILLFISYAYIFISSLIETDRQTNKHTLTHTQRDAYKHVHAHIFMWWRWRCRWRSNSYQSRPLIHYWYEYFFVTIFTPIFNFNCTIFLRQRRNRNIFFFHIFYCFKCDCQSK